MKYRLVILLACFIIHNKAKATSNDSTIVPSTLKSVVVYKSGAEGAAALTQNQIAEFLAVLQDSGLNVTKSGNGGFLVVYTPSDGGTGFSFAAGPGADLLMPGQNPAYGEAVREPPGESPVPASDFKSPAVGPTSP